MQTPQLNKPNQNILVTGGTGFIGKPLCQLLIDQGHNVSIVTRNMEKAGNMFNGRVTLIESIEKLNDEDDFDVVINLAGETIAQRWNIKSQTKMLESRIKITNQLVNFMKRAKQKPALFISSSAIGIYGTDLEKTFNEATPSSNDKTGTFPREVCEFWEAAASQAEKLGIRTCMVRTGIVLESDGGALAKMTFPFEFCLGGPMGSGKQWFSWIHRDDYIRLIYQIINIESLRGPINATAPEPITNKVFSRALGKAMKRPAILPMPGFQVKLLFGNMGKTLLLAGQKVMPQKALNSGFKFNYPNVDDALKAIFAK